MIKLRLLKKLSFWSDEIEKNNIEVFPCLSEFVYSSNTTYNERKIVIITHLTSLIANFSKRFEVLKKTEMGWIRDPFSFVISSCSEMFTLEKEQLIDI